MNYKEKLNNLHESVFGRIRGYDLQYQEDILKDWEELKQAYKGNKNEAIKELKQVWPQLTQNDLNLIKKESSSRLDTLHESLKEAIRQKFKKGDTVKTDDGLKGKITKSKNEFGRYGPEVGITDTDLKR